MCIHTVKFSSLILPNINYSYISFVSISSISALLGSLFLINCAVYIADIFNFDLLSGVPSYEASLSDMFGAIVFSPVIETFILIGLLKLLLLPPLKHWQICLVSSFIWACLHGMISPMSILGTIWSFYVFSHSYLTWYERSRAAAFFATLIPHMIINSIVVLSLTFYA